MGNPKLDPQKRDEVLRLKAKGYTHQQIADMAGVATGTVSNVAHEGNRYESGIDEYASYHKEKFSELLDRYRSWIGDSQKIVVPKKRRGKRIKAAAISDVHAPFHNEEIVGQAVRDNKDADECWVVGDLLDLFSFSRYEKFSAPFSPIEEFQSGTALLRVLAETFSVVRVMHGNHDERFIKWLVRDKGIPPAILEFFRLQCPQFDSPLAKICSLYPNVVMMEPKKLDFARFPFIHQIGDCVLSHAEKFSKIPLRATSDVVHWLESYAKPQGIVSDFRVVCQAHTHQAGMVWCDYNVLAIEMGCLARVPDYAGDPKLRGSQRPSVLGYTRIVQEDGVTDINETRFVRLA